MNSSPTWSPPSSTPPASSIQRRAARALPPARRAKENRQARRSAGVERLAELAELDNGQNFPSGEGHQGNACARASARGQRGERESPRRHSGKAGGTGRRADMARTLRQLAVPEEVAVSFRGEETSFGETKRRDPGNRYTVSLKEIRDSTKFRLRSPRRRLLHEAQMDRPRPRPDGRRHQHRQGRTRLYLSPPRRDRSDGGVGESADRRSCPSRPPATPTPIEVPLGTRLVIR